MKRALNFSQQTELKSMLDASLRRIKAEIASALEESNNPQYVELAGKVHDTGDDAVADLLSDMQLLTVNHLVREMRLVLESLRRIGTGDYGICEDCDDPIGFERLQAEPTAMRCLRCQEQFERRNH